MSSQFKFTEKNIVLRRNKVLELSAQSYSQIEISRVLGVHESLISLDMQWIREQAQEYFNSFLQKELPTEFKKAVTTFDYVIRTAANTAETTQDEKIKLAAIREMREARAAKMDLIANVDVMNYQASKKPHENITDTVVATEESVEEQEEIDQ